MKSGIKHPFLLVLLSIVILSGLINAGLFGSPSLAAAFFYVISASAFSLATGIVYVRSNKTFSLKITHPAALIFFILLTLYYVFQGILSTEIYTRHYLLISNCLLLLACCIFFGVLENSFSKIGFAILLLAGIESLICLLQFFGWVGSWNIFFKVTGTWINPNVTAMFIAMAVPVMWWGLFTPKKTYRLFVLITLAVSIIALALLKCRTAIIGASVVSAIMLNAKYNLVYILTNKLGKLKAIALFVLLIIIMIPVAIYVYHVKQASSDGRKLVWKVSMKIIADKPVTGVGYGKFEHDYNLYQAAYFESGQGTKEEINNASFVKMAYNEFLENAVEGGLPGLLLFIGIIVSLLIQPPLNVALSFANKRTIPITDKNAFAAVAAYAGIAAFAIMSVFNFTVQAVPVLCLFVIYAALLTVVPTVTISSNTKPHKYLEQIQQVLQSKIFIACLFIPITVFTCLSQISLAKAYRQSDEAKQLLKEGDIAGATTILKPLAGILKQSELYWHHYGDALCANKKYVAALGKYEKALLCTSDPEMYMQTGNCYYKTKQYPEAEKAYLTAQYIHPCLLSPRYHLMKLYLNTGDTAKALSTAYTLQKMQPKGVSAKAAHYKHEADSVIQKLTPVTK